MKRVLTLLLLLLAPVASCYACNIPVFRYALERWQPDVCNLIVFHDKPLSAADRKVIQQWDAAGVDRDGKSNIKVTRCLITAGGDSGQANPANSDHLELLDSLRRLGPITFPYVAVQTTHGRGPAMNNWHGTLDQAIQAGLMQSPVRKELSRRLLAGHSVVWLLLTSKDEASNEAAEKLLAQSFTSLQDKVELPEGIGLPGSELHSEVPLLLKYSMLQVRLDDSREQYLIDLLQGVRPEAVAAGQPLLVPVFGRGRILEVIPADEADLRLLEDLTRFLCGACSCQVKEQNPGFDLLITADWDTTLFGKDGPRPPPARSSGPRSGSPVLLTIPPGRAK
ncbi:MAG: hypothetical protein MI861_00740 [Pirellulales bacterium]|nr:hypothetical protein [Pirellulales bacterium]